MQINNHGTINQFKDDFNKPNTIFLAHSKRMHWVCFSNFYLETSKNKANGYYVIYDCFNKGDKEFSTRDSWLFKILTYTLKN